MTSTMHTFIVSKKNHDFNNIQSHHFLHCIKGAHKAPLPLQAKHTISLFGMAILLIGSTGNGKSTLGNYLLNPDDEHISKKQTFVTARDNKPQTQHVQPVTAKVSVTGHGDSEITVIDTPGLNEGAVRDLEHMICIVQGLKERKEIKACILVVKFNSKIDAQYKATVEYYSKLLPDLFENNVAIVMTDFATDERSIQMRRKQGIDVEQVKNNTVREIVECADMTYSPILFTIDCLPYDSDEQELNRGIRDALLEFIFLQKPTEVIKLKVAKPDYIQKADDVKKSKFEGEITGYNERLQHVHKNAKEALKSSKSRKLQ